MDAKEYYIKEMRKNARLGGVARAKKLSKARRREIAKIAVSVREAMRRRKG